MDPNTDTVLRYGVMVSDKNGPDKMFLADGVNKFTRNFDRACSWPTAEKAYEVAKNLTLLPGEFAAVTLFVEPRYDG